MQNVFSIFLKDCPPFNVLEKEQLLKIASNVKVIYFEKNSHVFKETEKPHQNFHIVKDRVIGLFRTIEKDQILVDVCDEGDIFGLHTFSTKRALFNEC